MSTSVKDRPDVGDCSGGGDDGGSIRRIDQNRRTSHDKKSKRVSLFRFRSVKKQSHRRNNRPSSVATPGGCSAGVVGRGFGGRLSLCFKPSPTMDSPGESQTSDPNSSEFTFELLKGLIEKNDFYSKECNTHLDVQSISSKTNSGDNL